MTSLEHNIIYNSKGPKKMKNAKEKTPQPPELQMQNTWKKRKQIPGFFPRIHETSQQHQKKKNIFSFKIIRNSDFDAHVS